MAEVVIVLMILWMASISLGNDDSRWDKRLCNVVGINGRLRHRDRDNDGNGDGMVMVMEMAMGITRISSYHTDFP